MDNCSCKLCKAGLRDVANSLSQSGEPIEQIISTLKSDHGFTCNSYTLKKHFEALDIPYRSVVDSMPTISVVADEPIQGGYHQPIDLNELSLMKWGLSPDDPAGIVSFLQEKLLVLGFQQMEIVACQQKHYLEGSTALEPSKESIQNLRILLTLADRFTAISLQANQQQAVRIVESLGYTQEGLTPKSPQVGSDRGS